MNKIFFIGIILIVCILILGGLAFVVIGGEGVIPSDDNDNPNPDSGDTNPDDPQYDVKFTLPSQAETTLSKKGVDGNYGFLPVEGMVYGTKTDQVKNIRVFWHNGIDYSNKLLTVGGNGVQKIDEYNLKFETDMKIGRLGTGSHTLGVKTFDTVGNVLSEASVNIVIPDYWIYEWDSRNPVKNDAVINNNDYFYGFSMPYKYEGSWYYLQGDMIRIKGKVYVGLYEGDCGVPFTSWRHLWLDIWNPDTNTWIVENKDVSVDHTDEYGSCPGLLYRWDDVDVSISSTYGDCIGFAGSKGHVQNDVVEEFVGEVWVKPGTINHGQSPLDIIFSLFSNNDFDNIPHANR